MRFTLSVISFLFFSLSLFAQQFEQHDCSEHEVQTRTQYETVVYAEHVPLVYSKDELSEFPLKLRISSTKNIDDVEIEYYDPREFNFKTAKLNDTGELLDEVAGDGIYTSDSRIVIPRALTRVEPYFYNSLLAGTATVFYSNGSNEDFDVRIKGFTVDFDRLNLDTSDFEIKTNGNYHYSKNAVNLVAEQDFSDNVINYPVGDFNTDLKSIWNNYKNPHLVFSSFSETNAGGVAFRSSANPFSKYIINRSTSGMTTAYPLNHEINHFLVYVSRFDFLSNHLRYIERPSSGFGYGCYNGVFTNLREENGVIKTTIDPGDLPHDYFYNDIELNLMGALPYDSIDFPIKYVKRGQVASWRDDCSSSASEITGEIAYLEKQEYIDFVEDLNREDFNFSEGLELKFIFITEKKLTKIEHAFLDFLVLNYEDIFFESTSELVELDTDIYNLNTSSTQSFDVDFQVTIFPNPTKGLVTFDLKSNKELTASLTDVTGRELRTVRLQKGNNEMEMSEFPSGVYFIRFVDLEGKFQVEKLIKS